MRGYEIGLDDGAIDQLLQLQIREIVPHHHLQNCEQFSVGDEPVLVDVVDLEGEAQLVLLVGAVERGETLMEMWVPERN